ncbi:DUF2442 domain-containing protein [Devosia sp. BSSL-BM10]|uniref:DUF2442 domain-containing protein n=1 Tax=Devosia litorisediminis TaxID=2829817 RepID=A0A942E6M8_9HYPH|nr:DUF2442 domain-containing protein [Devosia litorisediminis]MBS3849123.1 DUF2442 domain-containing protein [Devosia litorisediminis]
MSTLTLETAPLAVDLVVDSTSLRVSLDDGRELAVPLAWFPHLRDASDADRANWRLFGRGDGIHWPALDEDISVRGLLAGHRQANAA